MLVSLGPPTNAAAPWDPPPARTPLPSEHPVLRGCITGQFTLGVSPGDLIIYEGCFILDFQLLQTDVARPRWLFLPDLVGAGWQSSTALLAGHISPEHRTLCLPSADLRAPFLPHSLHRSVVI